MAVVVVLHIIGDILSCLIEIFLVQSFSPFNDCDVILYYTGILYRLDSRRNGGCPILAIGIGKECVEEYGRLSKYHTELKRIYEGEEV